jgi:hypothetical protein
MSMNPPPQGGRRIEIEDWPHDRARRRIIAASRRRRARCQLGPPLLASGPMKSSTRCAICADSRTSDRAIRFRGLGPDKSIAICGRVSCQLQQIFKPAGQFHTRALLCASQNASRRSAGPESCPPSRACRSRDASAARRAGRLFHSNEGRVVRPMRATTRCARGHRAPYLAALVASSCNITAMVCAVFGSSNRSAPAIRTRVSPSWQ